jgi:hypothetical protein
MSDETIPFKLAELPTRAPWWPHSRWATWSRIRAGKMAAIQDGHAIYVTVEILRRYLAEQTQKRVNASTPVERKVAP